MSKSIEFSDQDYARIQHAADADGVPVDAWVIKNLPLEPVAPEVPSSMNGKSARTMADLLSGLTGVVNSGGAERLSERHSEVFQDMLEEQRKAGRL